MQPIPGDINNPATTLTKENSNLITQLQLKHKKNYGNKKPQMPNSQKIKMHNDNIKIGGSTVSSVLHIETPNDLPAHIRVQALILESPDNTNLDINNLQSLESTDAVVIYTPIQPQEEEIDTQWLEISMQEMLQIENNKNKNKLCTTAAARTNPTDLKTSFICASIYSKEQDKKAKMNLSQIKQDMYNNANFACELYEYNDRHYAPIRMQEKWSIRALIDTGSEVTLISKQVYEQINEDNEEPNQLKLTPHPGTLQNVSGTEVPIIGSTNLEMKVGKYRMTHPVTVVDVPDIGVIIGGDCLMRLSPLIDYHNNILWAQVKRPIPIDKMHKIKMNKSTHMIEKRSHSIEVYLTNSQTPEITEITPSKHEQSFQKRPGHIVITLRDDKNWQTTIEDNCLRFHFKPEDDQTRQTTIIAKPTRKEQDWFIPIQIGNNKTEIQAKLTFNHERSCISEELYLELTETTQLPFLAITEKTITAHDNPESTSHIVGRTMIRLEIGGKVINHNFLVSKNPKHQAYIANDVLNRYNAILDLHNNNLWSRCGNDPQGFWDNTQAFQANQLLPYAMEMRTTKDIEIPPNTNQVTLEIQTRQGQCLHEATEAIIRLNADITHTGITTKYTPLVDIASGTCKILIDNNNSYGLTITKDTNIGMAIDTRHHYDDLENLILGIIPGMGPQEDGTTITAINTDPNGIFTIHSIHPYEKTDEDEVTYSMDEDYITFKMIHSDTNNPNHNPNPKNNTQTNAITVDLSTRIERQFEIDTPEVFPGFNNLMSEQLNLADACTNEDEITELKNFMIDFKDLFSKDSYDCGLTDLHEVRIPTDDTLPPIYERQYRLPLASIEDIAEIIKNLEQRKIIRQAHSTFNTPLLAVLKPSGSWRLCADLRKLNNRVHRSRWPLPFIDQGLAQIQGSKLFSTVDLTSGYWVLPIKREDQYKLAFTFQNKGYAWCRAPFGFINSGNEFNIFLHKAMPDAQERGTLTYVDDVLIKSKTFTDHIKELRHVFGQIRDAGAKISLQKAKLCRTKVDFLGHEITEQGINPQRHKIDAILKIKTPRCIKDIRSLLGMANYSRKFIEDYAELTQPLTKLLKKDTKWSWGPEQAEALIQLKQKLTNAPCLAYPQKDKDFYIELGFSETCLTAALLQKHDQMPKVIAYASKALDTVELKFNNCEKALLAAIWAIQHFRSIIQGEKIILETSHQSLQFLQGNKIKEGNLSNSRITSWLMSMQGFPIEIRYGQNKKNQVAQGLADLHDCIQSKCLDTDWKEENTMEAYANSPHKVYDETKCENIPTVYIDGCAFKIKVNGETTETLAAGIGNVWVNNNPSPPIGLSIGNKSSQIAELMAAYQAIQTAIEHNLSQILIVTDSIYVRNGFVEHLPTWKSNNMQCANKKPLKHGYLIKRIDDLVTDNNLTVYWRKTKGHSKTPGDEKQYNDLADKMANEGALTGNTLEVPEERQPDITAALTRGQTKKAEENSVTQWGLDDPNPDLIKAQQTDETISTFHNHILDPTNNPITPEDIKDDEDLKILMKNKTKFSSQDGILIRTSNKGHLQWVVPKGFRGIMLTHAHDEITGGHRGPKITHDILKELAYWPHMNEDIEAYCKGCLQCAQFQPSTPHHRAPLQKRGIVFPWSDLQIDFIGPVTKSLKGNKYMLTVTCLFTKWVECLPAPNCKADTTAMLLINHIFSRYGLCYRISSDRGTHFTADIMARTWEILGVKQQLHIAYRPASSGSVERYNQTIVSMLKKFVNETGRDWDVKLPLILMAIRATPSKTTGYSPFHLLTGRDMITPAHLLYHTSDQTLTGAATTHEYVANLRKHLQHAFSHAQKHLERTADQTKSYYDLKTTKSQYEVGDKVYLFNFARDKAKEKKFLPSWKGPYPITAKLSPLVYKLKIKRGDTEIERWFHINQLKACHPQTRLKQLEKIPVIPEEEGRTE